jgi:hypothetical protein
MNFNQTNNNQGRVNNAVSEDGDVKQDVGKDSPQDAPAEDAPPKKVQKPTPKSEVRK